MALLQAKRLFLKTFPVGVLHALSLSFVRRINACFSYLCLIGRLHAKVRLGAGGRLCRFPEARRCNPVLQSRNEWEEALKQVKKLGLPCHIDPYKNWDSLAMLDFVLRHAPPNASVLDAGASRYSTVLPWLYFYGYERLMGINLSFKKRFRRGAIIYEPGDLMRTRFVNDSFDVVVCQSVIEHGVDVTRYFSEMSRILKPGGYLMTSTDYWHEPVDTRGRIRYGAPVKIFSRAEIEQALNEAARFGLLLPARLSLDCAEKPIKWMGLEYTFLLFTLQKKTTGIVPINSGKRA